jgi:Sec7-like guanine-nucleotide exchange factor
MELHNEYAKRMQEEHDRQNHRLNKLEKAVEENNKLVISVEKLAVSVHSMVEEQKNQGERLETLENRDSEMWRKVFAHAITTIVGVVLGFLLRQLGL